MKMLLVIFRVSLDEDIQELLRDLNLKAYTVAPHVLGFGEAGHAIGTWQHPGFNSLLLAALEEDQARQVIGRFKMFRDELVCNRHEVKIPLHVFVVPCEQVV